MHQPRWAGGQSTPDSTAGTWSARIGGGSDLVVLRDRDSKKLLVLFLWRFELVLCLNYLL
jgi:hypothetical protein